MTRFSKAKMVLLATSLSLSACGSTVPAFPEVWQCQVNGTPRAFFCVNNKTKERLKLPIDSPQMKAAQCLSADDYRESESWVDAVIEIARKRCK